MAAARQWQARWQRVLDMVEFYVMREYRRVHPGEALARYCFDTFRGRWQMREVHNNARAQSFWCAIISRYTGGNFPSRRTTMSAGTVLCRCSTAVGSR
jgi:predicted acetyltransferase